MATGPASPLKHLSLVNRSIVQNYTASSRPGPIFIHQNRDRQQHGARLLNALNGFPQVVAQRKAQRLALGVETRDGITLYFVSAQGFELAFESLEMSRSGIELLNVRKTNDTTYAACFVPDGKLHVLVKKFTAYLTEQTPSNEPKNSKLVDNIESIGVATINALWTDDEQMPVGEGLLWWEAWLRKDSLTPSGAFLRFHTAAEMLGIRVAEQWLAFPERVVLNFQATRTQLAQSILLLNLVAEIRNADRPPVVPHDMGIHAQDAAVDDIVRRTVIGNDNVSVAIFDTGIARAHPMISSLLSTQDMHTVDASWGVGDHQGHGTKMAGMALYGDIQNTLAEEGPIAIPFRLESAKILAPQPANDDEDFDQGVLGAVTEQAVYLCEIQAGHRRRVICKAVTSDMHQVGVPSSYSAALDQLAFEEDGQRLFVVSAGNVQPDEKWLQYPESNHQYGVEQPAQGWNILTVGAYTEKTVLPGLPDYAGWSAIAAHGDLSPFSATSSGWREWPIKPEVLFEGGNAAVDGALSQAGEATSLQLLTTNRNFTIRPLTRFSMTSAATGQAAGLAARIYTEYPNAWPETARGLIVHHADWTPSQKSRYLRDQSQAAKRNLLRVCGYGVPNPQRVLHDLRNKVSMIAQETMQPYRQNGSNGAMNEMCIFQLPWPKEMLERLENARVKLRITLSYFVEPSPSNRGWNNRYRYASHGLRFDLRRLNESIGAFNSRVNVAVRNEDETVDAPADGGWLLGDKLRRLGSIHSDQWEGTAIELAARDLIAIYPVMGWWRQRLSLGRCTNRARFSLIVSLESEDINLDLHTALSNQLALPIDLDLG